MRGSMTPDSLQSIDGELRREQQRVATLTDTLRLIRTITIQPSVEKVIDAIADSLKIEVV